jgi:signal transduction histidine kinase
MRRSLAIRILAGVVGLLIAWTFHLLHLKREIAKVESRLSKRFAERERLARDLYDTFLQGMQGLLLSFQSASRGLPADDATRALLDRTLLQSDTVMRQGRELVFKLRSRSRDADDLQSLLEAYAIEFARHYPAEFHLTTVGEATGLNPHLCEELCKMGYEALSNAYRHARAGAIKGTIEYRADSLRLAISDDGIGIGSEVLAAGGVKDHRGLPGMKERALGIGATLKIASSPSCGTCVQIEVPAKLAYISQSRSSLKRIINFFSSI